MSSTKAIGLASPTMPISSENPALRTFQKSSLSASTSRLRTPRTPGRPSNLAGQVVGPLGQLVGRVGVELGRQNGRRAALGEVRDDWRMTGSGPPGRGSSGRASRRRPGRSRRSRPAGRGPPGSSRTRGRPAPGRPGRGTSLSSAAAATASVPSEPTINLARLNCQGSSCQPAGRTGRPGTNSSRL